jgi:hypothetical protein
MTFPWFGGNSGESDSEEKRRLERDLAVQVKARQRAERQIDELNRAHAAAESRFRQLSIENRSMVRQHADKIATLTMEHLKSMGEAKKKYDRDIDSLKQEHNSDLKNLETNHGRMVSQLNNEISKLVGQLLVNQDDNEGWPDDKLKIKYRELQRLIESVTSPRNKEFLIPPNQQLGLHLDPTNFLSRAGRGKSHFVLKSTIWAILHERFFCAPFGFGALGPGKAHRELMEVYSTWRKLFDSTPGTGEITLRNLTLIALEDEILGRGRPANLNFSI